MTLAKKYGFTSVIYANRFTLDEKVEYLKIDGTLVLVDFVDDNPEGTHYAWKDKVCIGEVVKCTKPRARSRY